ncbi:MAG: hypothetical protein ACE37F_01835 [Nannocystaceae bacterium]|nr:hypothetical protein [bacterium]
MFRFLDAAEAQRAMAGELASDGVRSEPQLDFAQRVAQRLEVLRQLNRRRDAVRLRVSSSL